MVSEADIDRIIRRNLNLDDDFPGWFLTKILGRSFEAVRCHADSNFSDLGEVDIRAEFRADSRRILAFIEDKIDARPTPEQFERYRQRVDRERLAGAFDEAVSVLVAPRKYLDGYSHASNCFNCLLSYEELLEGLTDDVQKQLLSGAITKAHTSIPPDPERTKWKADYFRIAKAGWSKAAPQGDLTQPLGDAMCYQIAPKPRNFFEFSVNHHVWDQRDRAIHNSICVTMNFKDRKHRDLVDAVVKQNLAKDLRVEYGLKESNRIYVYSTQDIPHVEITKPAEEQAESIRRCAEIARQLHDWALALPGIRSIA